MKLRSLISWTATLLIIAGLTASCGSEDTTQSGDGGASGDGGTTGDGDGSGGTTGDGDGDGGAGGETTSSCPEECPDDGNPCTEDVCNPGTGECGIPRTGNACDDGIYCNGADTCEDGECTAHAGNPCPSADACDEGTDACGCAVVSECPGADISGDKYGEANEWGEIEVGEACEYDSECDETCSCTVTKTTYECTSGECVESNSNFIDANCDVRITEDTPCTNDGNECNGDETCTSGACTPDPSTAPICGGGTPQCRDGNNTHTCVECTVDAHCAGGEECCFNVCQPEENTCQIVFPTLSSNIVPTLSPTLTTTLQIGF